MGFLLQLAGKRLNSLLLPTSYHGLIATAFIVQMHQPQNVSIVTFIAL